MKLSLITVLAAISLSLSLLACDEKKEDAAKPSSTIVTSVTAAPGSSAKPAGTGAGW